MRVRRLSFIKKKEEKLVIWDEKSKNLEVIKLCHFNTSFPSKNLIIMTMMTVIIFIIYTGRCTHIVVAGDSIVGLLMKYAVIFVGV